MSSGGILGSLAPPSDANGGILGSLAPPSNSALSSPYWLQTATPFGIDLGPPAPSFQPPLDYPRPHQWPGTLLGPTSLLPPPLPPTPPPEHLESAKYWGATPTPSGADEPSGAQSFYLSPVPPAPSWDHVPTHTDHSTTQIFSPPPDPSSWGTTAAAANSAAPWRSDEFIDANTNTLSTPPLTAESVWDASPPRRSLSAAWGQITPPAPSASPVEDDPFARAAFRTRQSVRPDGGRQEGRVTSVLENYLPDVANQLATLPDRTIEALARYNLTGEFDPAPFVETALLLTTMRRFRARPPDQRITVRSPELSGATKDSAATRTAPPSNPTVEPQRRFELDQPQAERAGVFEPYPNRRPQPSPNSIEDAFRANETEFGTAQARTHELNQTPPTIPLARPATEKERNDAARAIARWLARNPAQTVNRPTWLREYEPSIEAYLDPPKTLKELQLAASAPKEGYNIHHIVEQTPAKKESFPQSMIDAPENLASIPKFKHWEINGWYGRPNKDFGGLSPRDYLRGKDWAERTRVGLRALLRYGVLKP